MDWGDELSTEWPEEVSAQDILNDEPGDTSHARTASGNAVGSILVHNSVPNRGGFVPPSKGRDFFAPLALESMFQQPQRATSVQRAPENDGRLWLSGIGSQKGGSMGKRDAPSLRLTASRRTSAPLIDLSAISSARPPSAPLPPSPSRTSPKRYPSALSRPRATGTVNSQASHVPSSLRNSQHLSHTPRAAASKPLHPTLPTPAPPLIPPPLTNPFTSPSYQFTFSPPPPRSPLPPLGLTSPGRTFHFVRDDTPTRTALDALVDELDIGEGSSADESAREGADRASKRIRLSPQDEVEAELIEEPGELLDPEDHRGEGEEEEEVKAPRRDYVREAAGFMALLRAGGDSGTFESERASFASRLSDAAVESPGPTFQPASSTPIEEQSAGKAAAARAPQSAQHGTPQFRAQAEDFMARIKGSLSSPAVVGGGAPGGTPDAERVKEEVRRWRESPRKLLRRFAAAEEAERSIERERLEDEVQFAPPSPRALSPPPPPAVEFQTASHSRSPSPSPPLSEHASLPASSIPARHLLLPPSTRIPSTSSGTLSSQTSSSQARKVAGAPNLTRIAPEEWGGIERMGGMRFDWEHKRWVGEGAPGEGEEERDVFEGIESFGDEEQGAGGGATGGLEPVEEERTTQLQEADEVEEEEAPDLTVASAVDSATETSPPLPPPAPAPTPARPAMPPVPPRSALKQGSTPVATTPGRSVSFQAPSPRSLRKERGGAKRWSSWGTSEDERSEDEEDGDGEVTITESTAAPGGRSMMSARSKRIVQELDELGRDVEDLSLDPVSSRRSRVTHEESLSFASPSPSVSRSHSTTSTSLTITAPPPPRPLRNASAPDRTLYRSRPPNSDASFLTQCSFGVNSDAIVKALTDVEPFEPFWDRLTSLSLRDKGLDGVVRLKKLVGDELDVLDLGGNRLEWLTGVPRGLRTLSVERNRLTSLTSFNHLLNLEHLDLSHNQLDSVLQLAPLRRLRELKLDGNRMTSLDGLERLDGLVKLSARNNRIARVDCARTSWARLESLQLAGNGLEEIAGLEMLENLVSLNLDENALISLSPAAPLTRLRVLRCSRNALQTLDAHAFPGVRTLYADNNRLARILHARTLTKLENLSLREQGGGKFELSLKDIRDVKRLYLSSNSIPATFPAERCYHLEYLELASCSLSALPANLATLCPNLRVVNLNYNFVEDLRPLTGLERLRRLSAVGNRLERVESVEKALKGMHELELLDLRMNPCTLALYLPLIISPSAPAASYKLIVPRPSPAKPSALTTSTSATPPAPLPSSDTPDWASLDAKFRRALPDAYYVKRVAYRGLLAKLCPALVLLDGLAVGPKEKEKAERLSKRLGAFEGGKAEGRDRDRRRTRE